MFEQCFLPIAVHFLLGKLLIIKKLEILNSKKTLTPEGPPLRENELPNFAGKQEMIFPLKPLVK